jgi:hypothetical protein
VNSGRPVWKADYGELRKIERNWWRLENIAPVPRVFDPRVKDPSDFWYAPETAGKGIDVYNLDQGFGKTSNKNR